MGQETPTRRPRAAAEGDTRDPKRQRRSADLFFSTLNSKSLQHILRCVSSKPRVDQWLSFVDAKTARSIMEVGGPLSDAAKQVYNAVELRLGNPAGEWAVPAPKLSTAGGAISFIRGKESGKQFLPFMRQLGTDVVDVRMEYPSRPDLLSLNMPTHVENVRHLSLWTPYDSQSFTLAGFLEKNKGKLESLELRVPFLLLKNVFDIVANVRGVRRLALSFAVVEATLEPVWEMQGEKLEELHIRRDVEEEERNPDGIAIDGLEKIALETLPKVCKNVKVLSFTGFHNKKQLQTVEEVCTGYGEKLESLKIIGADLTPEYRERINAACPRVSL